MTINLQLTSKEHKDLISYCELNKLDPDVIMKKSYLEGFSIEKYGLLGKTIISDEKRLQKEVIVEKRIEIPVEVIKEVVKVEYVEVEKPVEKIVEVIKEVPTPPQEIEVIKYVDREVVKEVIKEVPVEKIVYIYDKKEEEVVPNLDNICDNDKINELLLKIQQLEDRPPKTIEVIKEVIKEVPVEVIKEVIVEKEVIKEVMVEGESPDSKLKPKLDALQHTVQKLKLDNIEKDKLIQQYEKTIQDIQKFNEGTKAMYLKGSNLDNKL
jgi:hypothetical protein